MQLPVERVAVLSDCVQQTTERCPIDLVVPPGPTC
jgi:hypothetical protein